MSVKEDLARISEQQSRLHEAQKLDSQKLDFLVNSFHDERADRKRTCEAHACRLGGLENWRLSVLAGFAAITAWIKFGGHK